MIYAYDITVEAKQTDSPPQKTTLELTTGYIHLVEVVFPPGPSNLVHLTINRGGHQVWPSNPDGDFIGDGIAISFREEYWLLDEPLDLVVHTWSPLATEDHKITVRLGLLRGYTFE